MDRGVDPGLDRPFHVAQREGSLVGVPAHGSAQGHRLVQYAQGAGRLAHSGDVVARQGLDASNEGGGYLHPGSLLHSLCTLPEDLIELFGRRRGHTHEPEAPDQGLIRLHVLGPLFLGRGADDPQAPAGKVGLEGVQHAVPSLIAKPPHAHETVELIDEEDQTAVSAQGFDELLHAPLEGARVLGAGIQRIGVEREDPASPKLLGGALALGSEPPCQLLDDGGLPGARLPDQHDVRAALREQTGHDIDEQIIASHELVAGIILAKQVAEGRQGRGQGLGARLPGDRYGTLRPLPIGGATPLRGPHAPQGFPNLGGLEQGVQQLRRFDRNPMPLGGRIHELPNLGADRHLIEERGLASGPKEFRVNVGSGEPQLTSQGAVMEHPVGQAPGRELGVTEAEREGTALVDELLRSLSKLAHHGLGSSFRNVRGRKGSWSGEAGVRRPGKAPDGGGW